MSDTNNMSIEELMQFSQEQVLPDRLGVDAEGLIEEGVEEDDINSLSPEDLLSIAEGETVQTPKADSSEAVEEKSEEEDSEASVEDLMSMLENTVGEDEIITDDVPENVELAADIEKIKLRQLANRIETMAPAKLFPPRKDEIYYFITSMLMQTQKFSIDNAQEKCAFIGGTLKTLSTYMITEIDMSMDEVELIINLFDSFSEDRIDESEARERINKNFRSGWKQSIRMLGRDITKLVDLKGQRTKPFWQVVKYYDCLVSAYGLAKAQEDSKIYKDVINVDITKEEKRDIVSMFEDVMDIAGFYGLKIPPYMNRQEAYKSLKKLQLDELLKKLKATQNKR
jgi:hypothetical protein